MFKVTTRGQRSGGHLLHTITFIDYFQERAGDSRLVLAILL